MRKFDRDCPGVFSKKRPLLDQVIPDDRRVEQASEHVVQDDFAVDECQEETRTDEISIGVGSRRRRTAVVDLREDEVMQAME